MAKIFTGGGPMSCLCLALLALTSGPGAAQMPAQPPPVSAPSTHLEHSQLFGGEAANVRCSGADAGRSLNRTVFGFLPYWTGSGYLEYDLISVLALFSVEMDQYGSIWAWHGFPEVFLEEIDSAHAAGALAVATVTNFDSDQIHSILTSHSDEAISTMCDIVVSSPVDGICVDFEQVSASDRDNLSTFMEELESELEAQAPGSHLSICTPAVDWSGAFDYSLLCQTADAVFIMCYPFHGSWSSEAGPCCPLTGWGGAESASNMAWCLGDYIIHAPEGHERLVVGLPYYGHQWETESQYPHSPVDGGCSVLVYATLADRAAAYGRLWDEESLTPWYAYQSGGWNQGWFDDPESLSLKYDLIRSSNLQGVGIWALGYDQNRPELWDCLEESFAGPVWQDSLTDNLESLFRLHGPSQYWHQATTQGQRHGLFYTYSISSGPDVNWASWQFDLPDSSAEYALSVFIPDYGADAEVLYRVSHGAGIDTLVVDQGAHAGEWVELDGSWPAGNGLSVTLGDCTGTGGQRILFDAIRYQQLSGTVEAGEARTASALVVQNPARAGRLRLRLPGSSAPRVIEMLDLAGREVLRDCREGGGAEWVTLTSGHLPAGVYLLRLTGDGERHSARVVLLP